MKSFIHGYSVYKEHWEPKLNEEREQICEPDNHTIQYNLLINSPTGVFQNQFTYNNGKK